jgi:hypothetical protein
MNSPQYHSLTKELDHNACKNFNHGHMSTPPPHSMKNSSAQFNPRSSNAPTSPTSAAAHVCTSGWDSTGSKDIDKMIVMDTGISILIYITYVYIYCLQLLLITLDSAFIGSDHFMIIE